MIGDETHGSPVNISIQPPTPHQHTRTAQPIARNRTGSRDAANIETRDAANVSKLQLIGYQMTDASVNLTATAAVRAQMKHQGTLMKR